MNPVPILPARLDWPSAIGSLLLNFGSLEHFVSVFLKDHLAEAEFEKVKHWYLVDRLNRIARQLQHERRPQTEQDRFAALVARLIPLREIRNQIAHGQLHVIYQEPGKIKLVLLLAKDVDGYGLPETKELEFAELEKALTAMAAVTAKFEKLAGFK